MSRLTQSVDPNPFGFLRGPYRCTTSGCTFSSTAEIDLIRRGFSFDEIRNLNGIFRQDDIRASTVRPPTPRQVDVQVPTGVDVGPGFNFIREDRIRSLESQVRRVEQQIAALPPGVENFGFSEELRVARIALERERGLLAAEQAAASTQTVTISGLDLVVNTDNTDVADNPLNCYTDVQYHVVLSMLSQAGALEFQRQGFNVSGTQINLNELRTETRANNSVTLASTGDVFGSRSGTVNTGPVGPTGPVLPTSNTFQADTNNYYSIENLTVKNLMEPSQTNPLVSTMLSMKMQIAEPHGFKLHEDIRDTACKVGYTDINPGRVLYRVDIYFSGYHQDSGEWIEQIDLSNNGSSVSVISSVMSITNIEAEVTSSGTLYELDLVPAGHHAYRPEDFILDANTINSGSTFRDFLTNFSTALKDAKEKRTQGVLLRNYEFFAPTALLDSPFDANAFFEQNKFLFESTADDHVVTSGRDVDIMTILRGAIANTTLAHELFIADQNNDNFTRPRVHFGLRFNCVYGDSNGAITVDSRLNDYKELTHQYIIEPYVTFKHGPVNLENMETYVAPDSQMARIREIVRFGMLRRIYNYIYTAENTEVIDFDIKLKAFYYHTLNTSNNIGAAGRQGFNAAASQAISQAAGANDLFRILAGDTASSESVDATIRRLFGDVNNAGTGSGDSCNRTGAARLGGGFNETGEAQYYGSVVSPPEGRRGDYETYMDDYLSLDLLQLNGMQVRGDPVWMLSPYANQDIDGLEQIRASEGVAESAPSAQIQVRPRQGQIIFLKIRAPEQDDHMNPQRSSASSYPNIIGGFYQLTSVTSTFSGGKFTQSLEGIKLNHLNYAEGMFQTGSQSNTIGPARDQREPAFDLNTIRDAIDNASNLPTATPPIGPQ